jgi:hypothetical protein
MHAKHGPVDENAARQRSTGWKVKQAGMNGARVAAASAGCRITVPRQPPDAAAADAALLFFDFFDFEALPSDA